MSQSVNFGAPALPSFADRRQAAALAVSAALLAAAGLWMLIDPAGWFAATPGAAGSGPFNPHFVRDVGAEFVALAVALAWAARHPAAAFPLTAIAALALWLHAGLHGWEVAAGHAPADGPILAS